jgi:hypothetical protein
MTRARAAVAAYGLPSDLDVQSLPVAADAFDRLLSTCAHEGLLGLLGAAVADEAIGLSESHHATLERELQRWFAHMVRIEQVALRALTALEEAGIEARVLEGIALAHTAYSAPERRIFSGADVLVRSDDHSRAAAVLERELDAERELPELGLGVDERFGEEVTLRVDGLELNLHRTFVGDALGLAVDLDDLFAPPYRFPLAGFELQALPMPQRLLHACCTAALDQRPPRLASLRDVAEIVLRERPNLVDVLLMAKRWQCEVVVARAVSTTWRELAITRVVPIVEFARGYVPSRRERLPECEL